MAAQSPAPMQSHNRERQAPPGSDTLRLDSLPIVAESIQVVRLSANDTLQNYRFYGGRPGLLIFTPPLTDSVRITYRTIGLRIPQSFQNKSRALIIPKTGLNANLQERLYSKEGSADFTPFSGLNSQGSIARSVSVGNNQDAVLNSSLNLQLTGNLGENTQIRASINDNNVPVQADGFTQQLREFDRVYLELENSEFGLVRAGDFNMLSQKNYFLQFNKRISGAGVLTGLDAGKGRVPMVAQAGIARGRFARNRFQGQEGNQGPYKLRGNNSEQFIIIISGSERVYIDGILQTRGQQNDYVIDYNAGELTFTANQPITKDKRIVIEFQFSERSFLRPIVFGQTGFESEKFTTVISHYSEKDSRNQTLTAELSDADEQRLSQVGDNIDQAFAPSISPSEFDADQILYELRDTLNFDSVLVFSKDSTAALFQASFTLVGANKGHYRIAQSVANGRVFEWVAPVNGVPQGNYRPVRRIPVPNQLNITAISTRAILDSNQSLQMELAVSNNDRNLFSDLDEGDDVGLAGKANYELNLPVKKGALTAHAGVEFNQDNFRTVERIREVEFTRNWNLPINSGNGLVLAQTGLRYKTENWRSSYQLGLLSSDGQQGIKHNVRTGLQSDKHIGQLQASWLSTRDSLGSTDFIRHQARYRYFVKPQWWLGTRSLGEWNQKNSAQTKALTNNSYRFLEGEFFSGVGDTSQNFAEAGYRFRTDDTARGGALQRFTNAHTFFARSTVKTNFNSRLQVFLNFRTLRVKQPEELPVQRTFTSRFNYVQRFFKNAVTSTTFYKTGAGSEPRRNFSFVEVPAGQGTHTHLDFNDNGQKELNEFQIAPSPDLATYVRVFTPSSQFVRTSVVKLGQNFNIRSPSSWSGKKGLRKLVSKFSALTNYQVDRKTLLSGQINELNPFTTPDEDTLIVGLVSNVRATLFYNRSQNKVGGDYTFRQSDSRNLVSFGVQQRQNTAHELNLRYAPWPVLILRSGTVYEDKVNREGLLKQRNFEIDALQLIYSLSYQVGQHFTLTGSYRWQQQQSQGEEPMRLRAQNAGLEVVWNVAEKISLRSDARYIFNKFEGAQNSPVGFEMLENLQPGANGTLELTLQRTLFKNIVLSLNYNGRISRDNPAVHFGNLEVKAFF